VREYWVIDPLAHDVTVFHLRDGRFDAGDVFPEGTRLRAEVLEGVDLAVADLFPSYT
jgi:Uma2 family endonuclease